nr:DUF805 domain-containing protein [uncultured Prevotella sp.]
MATRKELLKNLKNYSPEEIAEAVREGVVSLYELSKETEGAFTPLLKKKVKAILEQPKPVTTNNVHEPTSGSPIPEVPVVNPLETSEPSVIGSTDVFQQADDNKNKLIEEMGTESISNKGMFKRPFSFHGRIRRTEYGISFIVYFIWAVILNAATASNDMPEGLAIFLIVTYVPMIWFLWAQNCKRCHDRGNSGWYQLIPFYFFVLLFGDGEEGTNDYGDNPKD